MYILFIYEHHEKNSIITTKLIKHLNVNTGKKSNIYGFYIWCYILQGQLEGPHFVHPTVPLIVLTSPVNAIASISIKAFSGKAAT